MGEQQPPAGSARSLHHRRWHTVTVYVATSLTAQAAHPAPPCRLDPRPAGIESLHTSATPTFAEDASHTDRQRPRAMASLRNLAIAILCGHGHRNIAAALCRNARDATPVLPLLGITSP
jgi:hypothetical protein